MTEHPSVSIGDLLSPHARRTELDLSRWLLEPSTPPELAEAMRYCTLGGGKRLRPALVFLSAAAAGGKDGNELTARAAVAVELVHCYSLVHDDLPAMDNDTLRRGQPTAHVKFGEAMAILAGDALLTRAMAVLAESPDPRAGSLVVELASAAGCAGMIAGQVADMKLCCVPTGVEGLHFIHLRKTAALIRGATRMGAISAGAAKDRVDALGRFGERLGLAFQLIDDLLDATGSAATLGKTPGKDADHGKRTHVAEIGMAQSKALGEDLTRQALAELSPLGDRAESLRTLTLALAARTH